MLRWHLTLLLGIGAAAALWLTPEPGRSVAPLPFLSFKAPGDLEIALALDHGALLAGSGERRELVVTVRAPEARGARVPVDVALVVDVSGSMGRQGKIAQARAAAHALVDALEPGDRFALVAFEDYARVLAHGAPVGDRDRLHAMVEGLTDEGGTNLYAGMRAGLDELDGTWAASKVLVVSDGNANVGVTEPTGFYELARRAAAEGATVSTIGLGTDFNEVLVEGVADAGGGSYTFVGYADALPGVIASELAATTELVARRATVHVDVPEGVHVHQVYGWDAEVSSGGADVYIGDLSAGQERTIVLQVSIPDQTLGTVPVATATLDYTSLDGATHADTEHLDAIVSDRIGTVERSVDTEAATIAARARASVHLRRSAEAARDGDVSTARARMADARDVVLAAAAQLQVPELAQSVVDLEALEELGAREGNAYAAKAASEASRDWSR